MKKRVVASIFGKAMVFIMAVCSVMCLCLAEQSRNDADLLFFAILCVLSLFLDIYYIKQSGWWC